MEDTYPQLCFEFGHNCKGCTPETARQFEQTRKGTVDANYPQLCFEVGLTCEACTAETAGQLAQSCRGLRGKAIGQLFVQIHPHSACARMHRHFSACYLEASAEGSQAVAAVA